MSAVIDRRALLLGGIATAASLGATVLAPAPPSRVRARRGIAPLVPEQIGPWRAIAPHNIVLPAPDALRDRLYDEVVTRVYAAPGMAAVMLVLAYSRVQDGMVQVHRPEICYPASGFTLAPEGGLALPLAGQIVPCQGLVATRGARCEHLLYFTRIGQAFPKSWASQRWAVLQANLAGKVPDGLLLRVSTLEPDPARAHAGLNRFLLDLAASGTPAFRRLMCGSAS